ncbi:hypothetical protein [Jiella sonneratiae]|uniref:Alpha/beta hydrolase n=1 Tax=Jiella sonneratiae TaxID=2816856 RepID=A0ABS3J1C3_9HYPH|nr:hypothetical protein [Jiella sonneratiae]MBO0903462.1 hypothetical protein [Jiella sonneratiae]
MISRRLVCLFPGFEPMRADAHRKRFRRGVESAAALWDLTVGLEEPAASGPDGLFPQLKVRLGGAAPGNPPWRCDTEIVFFDWGDLILAYAARPVPTRFATGYLALADFLVTGTVFRYFKVSWRYGLFYLFPLVVLAAALLLGWLGGTLATALVASLSASLGGVAATLIGVVVGLTVAAGVLVLAQRRLHLLTALDDWAMARDICRDRNPAIRQRILLQAEELAARLAPGAATGDAELVVAAHSLGAVMAVRALDEALRRPALSGLQPHLLTVGSSLMKTALHPSAREQRAAVRHLVADRLVAWTDCQGLSDPINFYKSNPATSLGIEEGRTPRVVRVHFRKLVKPETYRRIKRDFFRLHRQFVLPVEKRAPYSFHMLLTGPHPVSDLALEGTLDRPPLKALPEPPKEIAAKTPTMAEDPAK